MKKLMMAAVMLGLTGGASAEDALKTLAAQATAETASASVSAPAKAALTEGEVNKQAYDTMAGLFASGHDISLDSLADSHYYPVDLITVSKTGEVKRDDSGNIQVEKVELGYHGLVQAAPVYNVSCRWMFRIYYKDSTGPTALLTLSRPTANVTIEIKQNGKYKILKVTGMPDGTGYGLVLRERNHFLRQFFQIW
ncbi:MAG: hypothetical protein NTX59_00700 [Elusimicrobia bacterium]|nr:hypothetical protein [Elusimicrobiota bacterium]